MVQARVGCPRLVHGRMPAAGLIHIAYIHSFLLPSHCTSVQKLFCQQPFKVSPINLASVARLRSFLSPSAAFNLPGDSGYSNDRWALNAEQSAAAVVCPATPEDVVQILAFAQGKSPYEEQKLLPLAVKGDGHTPSGASSSEGGLVIDLHLNMHTVRVDPDAKLAYVGGGCLWQEVDEATAQHAYLKLNHLKDAHAMHGNYRSLQGSFVPYVPEGILSSFVSDVYHTWLKYITEHPSSSVSGVILELYHPGKWSSIPSDATAFVHRKAVYNLAYIMTWSDPPFTEHASKVALSLHQDIIRSRHAYFPADSVGEGEYTNYMDEESRVKSQDFANRRFGESFPRLVEIKLRYDPPNVFGRWFDAPR
ncbi:hypothetical protein B0J17DRAFT_719072 [Rhizoctonia solani]|nr:hypothetical protein B0J17DRAFT_719072 [Rhizoctonia solani]